MVLLREVKLVYVLKSGIIVLLAAMVGFALVRGIMLIRIVKSTVSAKLKIWECLAELFIKESIIK